MHCAHLQLVSHTQTCTSAFLHVPVQIMIGVQHFAHFYLTLLLLDKLKASVKTSSHPTRIVFTTSASEATGQTEIPWDNLG